MATQQLADINIADWHVLPAQRNQYGANTWPIACNKDSKAPARVQLTQDGMTLRCPFGVSSYGGETGGRQNLDFSIPAWLADLRSFLQAADKFALDHVWEHRAEFFPKKVPSTKETLQDWYHPLLSFGKPEYDPVLRTKVSQSTPVFLCSELADEPTKKGNISDVTPGATCVPIITISKIWVMGGNKFGVTATTQALLLFPRTEKGIEDLGFVTAHVMPRSQGDAMDVCPQ